MFKFNKKVYITILSILILSISCKNTMTDSTNGGNGENNGGSISGGGGDTTVKTTVQYGSKSASIDISNYEEVKKLWLSVFTNKVIYKSQQYTDITGYTDEEGNYRDKATSNTVRTRFMFATNIIYLTTNYIAGVYFDEISKFGNAWRLITVTDSGFEAAFFGTDGTPQLKNTPATKWQNYDKVGIIFGYLKEY